ncbi:hypothetical protein, partial [Ramlibacter sp.]|uniref:hypothetical protein n=1 Tax=Ramlibacter sp. TaxID=1917967 RepID=UPI002B69C3C6
MKATPRDIDHALRQARQIIQTLGLLLDANENATERVEERVVRVTWATASVRPDLSSFVDSNIEEYLTFVRGRHYS